MTELVLAICLLGLITFAVMIIWRALHTSKTLLLTILPIFILTMIGTYWYFGGWSLFIGYNKKQLHEQQTQALLAKFKNPLDLAQKLQQQLNDTPASARGWYLLGRLYMSQNDLHKAQRAFAQAMHLKPKNVIYTVSYLQSNWELNGQKFSTPMRAKLNDLLRHHSSRTNDVLALLALDCYTNRRYQQAINIWQKLLQKLPPNSATALGLHKAIAKARIMLHMDKIS
ncbi:MAG: hypothetical protein A3E88_04460 [Legionellales bacterium RIFCSPHIGHO2_12_FULL_35_11]|nr:MAG: hypothetical protein A3E88_04460 [Legionellales bacterium RIFCSPHIGHO2_12_FULL_35_11]